jgi:hypothetical protein
MARCRAAMAAEQSRGPSSAGARRIAQFHRSWHNLREEQDTSPARNRGLPKKPRARRSTITSPVMCDGLPYHVPF